MKRLLHLALLATLALMLLVQAVAAQSPYPSLSFIRELNKEETTDYLLQPQVEEIHKRLGGADKPYRIVGVLARPSKRAAVLLFVNSNAQYQLDLQTDMSVVITIDSVDIGNLSYEMAAKNADGPLKLEIGNVLIRMDDLRKIANATSVTMKLGAVVHPLDRDNLTAFKYLVSEIDKDEKKTN